MKFDPRKPYDIWLDCFADVDKADRPVFTVRRCTAAEWEEFWAAMEDTASDSEEIKKQKRDTYFYLACKAIVGWKNQFNPATSEEVAYSVETAAADLKKLVSGFEVQELFGKICAGQQPNNEEKKR